MDLAASPMRRVWLGLDLRSTICSMGDSPLALRGPRRTLSLPLVVKSQEVVHPSLVWEAGGCETPNHPSTEARMSIHQHARTTPRSRERLVQRVLQGAESIRDVAEALAISDRTVRKWVQRYRLAGRPGLQDRSCRPHQVP